MTPESLDTLPDGTQITADVVIVGGGACGLTLARTLGTRGFDVVVLESGGVDPDPAHEALNRVEIEDDDMGDAARLYRAAHHGTLARDWDPEAQPYGLRLRGLGGATQAWAGKSAPFDPVDYAPRDWVPLSGWPVDADTLAPFVTRAEALLCLGPAHYGPDLWPVLGRDAPRKMPDPAAFRSMFWQFARSSRNPSEIMRFGADFLADPPPNVRLIVNATVTKLALAHNARTVERVEVASLTGRRASLTARAVVLAASAIENPRLLLQSNDVAPAGVGNDHDQVGRHLMDHPTAPVARFDARAAGQMAARFGFFSHRAGGMAHLYQHGLALTEDHQRREKLLNGAIFMTEERAPDDPFAAISRLLKGRSRSVSADLVTAAKSPLRIAQGSAVKLLDSGRLPQAISRPIVETAIRLFPNTVATQVRYGRLPHKFTGLRVEAISEQPPDPANRVTLGPARDALGMPVPVVRWQAGEAARRNLLAMGELVSASFAKAGLEAPEPVDWVAARDPASARVIDMGHSLGTTRMAASPAQGVVDAECQVFGVEGLFVAGGSVLPTSGHANPTLMMLALALRLGDHIGDRLASGRLPGP